MTANTPLIGNIHSIETMGLVDGPGVRTVFFLQGCPLRCAYCHNPDSQARHNTQAQQMTPQEVLARALRQKNYYGTEGGVTFSGGEPLLQGEFLHACLKLLKEHDINTALDTSGFGDPRWYHKILPLIDTLLLDVKAFTSETFTALTHGSFATYLDFLAALKTYEFSGQIWIRHVMLPGYTDNTSSMDELVQLILPLGYQVDRIEILPYHVMGLDKYAALGRAYALPDVPPMDEKIAAQLERYANRRFIQELQTRRAEQTREVEPVKQLQENQISTATDPLAPFIQEGIDLSRLPLLRHLSVADFQELTRDLTLLRVQKGEVFFRTGDPADRLFIVCRGQFKIFRNTVDGREQILYIYNPGDFVGGLNLLKGHHYLYTGQALEDSLICTLSKSFFDTHCLNNPLILRQILEKSYDRIRWAEDLIFRLSSANAGIKTAELILRFADRYGSQTEDGIRIDLNLNREELGSYAGLSRETFTRKLGEFKDLGYLEFAGNRVILIKDEKALREYYES